MRFHINELRTWVVFGNRNSVWAAYDSYVELDQIWENMKVLYKKS